MGKRLFWEDEPVHWSKDIGEIYKEIVNCTTKGKKINK